MKKSAIEIEIRHLRYFIAAADAGSFRKAAAALKVQESSVSRRIRDIEDQIGASLFVRHSGGINLTMAGQRFLHRARHALDHIRDGAAVFRVQTRSEPEGHDSGETYGCKEVAGELANTIFSCDGAPDTIRTCGLRLRREY